MRQLCYQQHRLGATSSRAGTDLKGGRSLTVPPSGALAAGAEARLGPPWAFSC